MEQQIQTPSFIASFVKAERFFTRQFEEPTEWLDGARILYRTFEILLQNIASHAGYKQIWHYSTESQIEILTSKVGVPYHFMDDAKYIFSLRDEVWSQINFRNDHSEIDGDFFELYPNALKFTGEIYFNILEATRGLAIWYLHDYSKGPRLSFESSMALLKGDSFPLPRNVFISYASEDQIVANSLYDALNERGHKPWMDKKNLVAGQEWEAEIRKAIENADCFIALMSNNSVTKRGFIQKEIRFALDVLGEIPPSKIYFIPIQLEPCEVPEKIKHLHWIDLQKDNNFLKIFRAIEYN